MTDLVSVRVKSGRFNVLTYYGKICGLSWDLSKTTNHVSANRKASDMSEREHLASSRMSHEHTRKSLIYEMLGNIPYCTGTLDLRPLVKSRKP